MKLIIPAAGRGTRLYPHTLYTPKPLLKVAGKPILEHILESVKRIDFEEVAVVISHGNESVAEFLKRKYQKVRTVYQDRREGLGDAVYQAVRQMDGSEDVLILLSDTLFDAEISPFIQNKEDFLVVKEVENPQNYGVVELDGDYIVGMEEKPDTPKSDLAIIGVYYITDWAELRDSLKFLIENNIKTRGEYQLTDALKMMLSKGWRPKAVKAKLWLDCGTNKSLLETNRVLLEQLDPKRDVEVIGDSVIIHPVYIGENVKLARSVIGPYVSIESWTKIENSIIKNSIIDENVTVSNYILDSSIISFGTTLIGNSRSVSLSAFSKMF